MLPSTPASAPRLFPPQLRLPATYTPKPYHYATYARYTGRVLDRVCHLGFHQLLRWHRSGVVVEVDLITVGRELCNVTAASTDSVHS
jgi:hypothetical protein